MPKWCTAGSSYSLQSQLELISAVPGVPSPSTHGSLSIKSRNQKLWPQAKIDSLVRLVASTRLAHHYLLHSASSIGGTLLDHTLGAYLHSILPVLSQCLPLLFTESKLSRALGVTNLTFRSKGFCASHHGIEHPWASELEHCMHARSYR